MKKYEILAVKCLLSLLLFFAVSPIVYADDISSLIGITAGETKNIYSNQLSLAAETYYDSYKIFSYSNESKSGNSITVNWQSDNSWAVEKNADFIAFKASANTNISVTIYYVDSKEVCLKTIDGSEDLLDGLAVTDWSSESAYSTNCRSKTYTETINADKTFRITGNSSGKGNVGAVIISATEASTSKTTVTATLSCPSTAQVGDWDYLSMTISGTDGVHEIATSDNSLLHFSSSDENVATVDTWKYYKAIGTGTVTFTATFDGDDYYEPFTVTSNTMTVSAAPATNSLTTSTLTNSETITLTTSSTLDLRNYFTANSTSTASNGVLYVEGVSPLSVASNGYTLSSSSATTTGSLTAYWHPEYAEKIDATTFVSGCLPQESEGNTTSTNSSTHEITVDNTGTKGYVAYSFNPNSWTYKSVSGYKYFLIELEEDLPSTGIIIAAEYGNNLSDDLKFFATGRYIYVPFKPNGQLKRIGIGGNTGQTTIKVKSCGFVNSIYTPASLTVNNIVVTSNQTIVQTNTIYRNNAVYDPTSIRFNNVYDTNTSSDKAEYLLGTVSHNGKDYVQVPYDYIVKVIPEFTDASTSEVLSPNYNCVGTAFDTDSEGNSIVAFSVGNNTTNKGVVTPLIPGYGDVGVSASPTGYNSTSQRTHIVIVKAVGSIRNPTGGYLRDVYSGTALGLTTKNSVNLDGKFKVFDANNNDITEYGIFSYESSSLTVSGSTISRTTATTDASVKIIWKPTDDYSAYYEAIHGTLYDIEVVNPAAGYNITVNPSELTLTENDTYDLSGLDVSVELYDSAKNTSSDVKSLGTVTYSIATSAETYINLVGNTLTAKLYDLEVNPIPVVTVTWTLNSDDNISVSKDVKVDVLKRVAFISSGETNLVQGQSVIWTITAFNDIDGDGLQDAGEGSLNISDVMPGVSVTDFLKSSAEDTSYLRAEALGGGSYKITALTAGKVAGQSSGSADVIFKYSGSTTSGSSSVPVSVTDNTLLDYMGWDLHPGYSGTLYNSSNPSQHYIHWRFGAPDLDEGVYVMRFNSPKYSFKAEVTALSDKIHNSAYSFDPFYETKLTDTKRTYMDGEETVQKDAKGDAFLEYNGMVAGYGTEKGGRYMTPISGTFVRVEAEYDGVVTVRIRHNGSIDTSDIKGDAEKGYTDIKQARRALYVVDENGVVMPRTSNYESLKDYDILDDNYRAALKNIDGTYARISDESKVPTTFDVVNNAYTAFFNSGSTTNTVDGVSYSVGSGNNVKFSQNAFHFIREKIYGYTKDQATQFLSDIKGGSVQKLFYSSEDDHVKYKAPSVADTTYFFSKYGYEVLGATHLVISFPVKAGKTYFVAANKSKIGMCTVEFDPVSSSSYTVTPRILSENATLSDNTNSWLSSTNDGDHLNVTLDRTFVPYRWHPLVLPFSVSETQLRSIFGENVSVIALDGSLKMLSSMNNYATRDGDFYDTETTYPGAGRTGNAIPFNGSVIKDPAIKDGGVTFTHHWYQMIYANCPVFLWFDNSKVTVENPTGEVKNPIFTNVTFQKYTKDKNDVANTVAIDPTYFTVTMPYSVDRQIGDGATYNYMMKASYVTTDLKDKEAYYVSNTGSGTSTQAHIYHSKAGAALTMKGMRVWIEPAPGSRSEPLRFISMKQYSGEDMDSNLESGINDIVVDDPIEPVVNDDNVYDLMGRVVARGSIKNLMPGIYIYQGRKYYVR